MLHSAKEGCIQIDDTDMNYISFGHGKRKVVLIPGLGDGLNTVKGRAIPMAFLYRDFVEEFTVYVFSRKNQLEEGYTTRNMARDQKLAMDKLGIGKADIVGVSQGGMIAQYIAIDYPEVIDKLVLTVTVPCSNTRVESVVGKWIDWAAEGEYKEIMIDTAEKMYTESYLKKYRWMYPILGSMSKPENPKRFEIMAKACLTHDACDELHKIQMPCLIIGAKEDQVVGGAASVELAEKITGSELYMYDSYGHGVFEEAKDFNERVRTFLRK